MADTREDAQKRAYEYKLKLLNHIFRHFKGGYYLVEEIAVHSETAELMVIYQSIDANPFGYKPTGKMWARPLDMFLSEVDHEKYPDVEQKMRFEMVR